MKVVLTNRKPAIWTDALQLATSIQQAVRHSPRYHNYALGSDLRRQAAHIYRLVAEAARFPERRLATLERLVLAVEVGRRELGASLAWPSPKRPAPIAQAGRWGWLSA